MYGSETLLGYPMENDSCTFNVSEKICSELTQETVSRQTRRVTGTICLCMTMVSLATYSYVRSVMDIIATILSTLLLAYVCYFSHNSCTAVIMLTVPQSGQRDVVAILRLIISILG